MNTIECPIKELRQEASILINEDDNAENKSMKVRLVANSGNVMPDMWHGSRVYDLEGYKTHKDKLTIDFCHIDTKAIGYASNFEITDKGLIMPGVLTGGSETSAQVIQDIRDGIPYEASITSEWLKAEIIFEDEVATVNGKEIEGPCVIVREWSLRGVAICPYGNDKNTSVEVDESNKPQVIFKVPVIPREENNNMNDNKTVEEQTVDTTKENQSKEVEDKTVEADKAEEQAKTESDVSDESSETPEPVEATPEPESNDDDNTIVNQAKPYIEAFGEDQGSVYFAKGLSMQDALVADNKAKAESIKDLKAKLDEASNKPVSQPKEGRGLPSPVGIDMDAEKNGTIEPIIRLAK